MFGKNKGMLPAWYLAIDHIKADLWSIGPVAKNYSGIKMQNIS